MQPMKSLVCAALVACAVAAPLSAMATNSINLINDGLAVPNTLAAPTHIPAFVQWCTPAPGAIEFGCFPTVAQPVHDMSTGQLKGTIYVWGVFPFNATAAFPDALCFREFFIVALAEGDLYAATKPNGTCGAKMDPTLKVPIAPATVVIAGGGDGKILGGTRKFAGWTGQFTDRVFVGFDETFPNPQGVNGIVYYESLMFSFTGK